MSLRHVAINLQRNTIHHHRSHHHHYHHPLVNEDMGNLLTSFGLTNPEEYYLAQ